jgi:hypothetical protein
LSNSSDAPPSLIHRGKRVRAADALVRPLLASPVAAKDQAASIDDCASFRRVVISISCITCKRGS